MIPCILHVCSLSPPPLHTLASAIAPRGAAGADIAYVTVLVFGLVAVLGSAAACGGASFEGRHGLHSVRLLSGYFHFGLSIKLSSFDHRIGRDQLWPGPNNEDRYRDQPTNHAHSIACMRLRSMSRHTGTTCELALLSRYLICPLCFDIVNKLNWAIS